MRPDLPSSWNAFRSPISHAVRLVTILVGIMVARVSANCGSDPHVICPKLPPSQQSFFAFGVAFDGSALYVNRSGDAKIYRISPTTGELIGEFDSHIVEWPAAMSFDEYRNGLWIGTQNGLGRQNFSCGQVGMPIYFWDFDDDSVLLVFTIPLSLLNPATGDPFFVSCSLTGLAFVENSDLTNSDDRLWITDDTNRNIGVFTTHGSLVEGYDATTVDSSLANCTGIALTFDEVYLTNDGLGEVFRTSRTPDPLSGQLAVGTRVASGKGWLADLECDDVTFLPQHVMWARTSPQSTVGNGQITANEIGPNGCGPGSPLGVCCDSVQGTCRDFVLQSNCLAAWTEGAICADLSPPCFTAHMLVLLDRTGSMQALTSDGSTRCEKALGTAISDVNIFFANNPPGSSVSVWTFRDAAYTPLTNGFVNEATAEAALDALNPTGCSGLTPLAESMCDAVDALTTTFPSAPAGALRLAVSTDGEENNSDGECDGPHSLAGTACGTFDPGSWQQKVCDKMLGRAIVLARVWGDLEQSLTFGDVDEETGWLRGGGVSDSAFFEALAQATGGTFHFVNDTAPPVTGTPAFGASGACCLPTGQCQENVTQAECAVLDGVHQGENETCDNLPVACQPSIPAVSEWGVVVMSLLIMFGGTIILVRYCRIERCEGCR